jgi:alginate O-acetyltransferase complex protein AlgI
MIFSSNIFLYLFLPIYLLVYYATDYLSRRVLGNYFPIKQTLNNIVLFILSLFFYYWGSGKFILVFLLSIVMNTLFGRYIFLSDRKKLLVSIGVIFNLSLLIYFKYYNFFYDQVADISLYFFGSQMPPHTYIFLPIGISFYSFMAISYLIEVYQGKDRCASLLTFGTYLTLFPHLLAGPIVRYSELEAEMENRKVTLQMFFEGIWRFSLGMGKKIILANNLGSVADKIFALPTSELTTVLAWAGIACYTLQIYFDFSGYSDMAIGLARFFGFHFPENFNNPYQSKNITEFWRRWHMTLSRWFKDYLYISLGGNRKSPMRTYFNLFLVFLLCGLWHGAAWTFVIWGMFHGILLVIERVLKNHFGIVPQGFFGNSLTLFLIMVGWVFFRSPSVGQALSYLSAMFGMPHLSGFQYFHLGYYLDSGMVTYLVIGYLIVLVPYEKFETLLVRMQSFQLTLAKGIVSLLVLFISLITMAKMQFTPFIYFQF